MSIEETKDRVVSALGKFKEGMDILSRGPAEFYLKKMAEYAEALFSRFAPKRRGDTAILRHAPEISEKVAPGWMASKHFLVAGAVGTVDSVDYYDGKFRIGVVFVDESWIDRDGKKQPVTTGKHVYVLSEDEVA